MCNRISSLLLLSACAAFGQALPGTQLLVLDGDPPVKMVDGMTRYLLRATEASVAHRHPDREHLKTILGTDDARVAFQAPELVATTSTPAKVEEGGDYAVYAIRWPALDGIHGEGLLFQPAGRVAARVVVLTDAGEQPEDSRIARRLAASGCQVIVPVILDRNDTWSGNPAVRMTNQPHREFIYRMAFMVGHHVIGYEVQKALAAVDWFKRESATTKARIGIWGYGEGGLLVLYAAAIDPRIDAAVVSGYFQSRQGLWQEPIYRNVWSLLKNFGDAEIATLVAPRTLIIETHPGPDVTGPPAPVPGRGGAAPGVLRPASAEAVRAEFERARRPRDHLEIAADAAKPFFEALHVRMKVPGPLPRRLVEIDQAARMQRQFQEMVDFTQNLVRHSGRQRAKFWAPADRSSPERWQQSTQALRARVWDEMIGRLPAPNLPRNPQTRLRYHGAKWDGYEVTLDLYPDVFAYGILLLPKDIRPGERRPVVVVQHGLGGRAQDMFGQPEGEYEADGKTYSTYHYYKNIGARLADMGFVVYSPQNPYFQNFRHLQRLANPLGLSLFSFILAQHDRLLDWLSDLPFVDPKRIGFYGLSYGGKTAIRVPPLLDRYALSICSGDFNEWIRKVTSVDEPFSYMFSSEWEIPEWNMGNIADHAELAMAMAPRPFMVERGHRDGVGTDEWVAYEYAKVRRFYDEMGIGERTRIEYFNGPHMIYAHGTIDFLKEFLK